MPDASRRRDGGSRLRMAVYMDPVAVVGIALSVLLSVLLDLTNAATGVESLLACLLGITVSLVLDSTIRAERRFRIRSLIEATPWLGDVLVPLVSTTTEIEHRYPGTPIADELQSQYKHLAANLEQLRRGQIRRPGDDYEYLLGATRECRRTLQAVTNVVTELPSAGLGWWNGDIGRQYWQANVDALDRGVRITRIFIYTTMTPELDQLIKQQERAGVKVDRVPAVSIAPTMRLNLALWDQDAAWEPELNTGGEIVRNIFTINDGDRARLHGVFSACARHAEPRPIPPRGTPT